MECPICFEVIKKDEDIVETACGHKFCKKCLNIWTELEDTCPLCREILEDKIIMELAENECLEINAFRVICSFIIMIFCLLVLVFFFTIIVVLLFEK